MILLIHEKNVYLLIYTLIFLDGCTSITLYRPILTKLFSSNGLTSSSKSWNESVESHFLFNPPIWAPNKS